MPKGFRPILIIHGWSDTDSSFVRLGELIVGKTGRDVQHINLADYVSLDDSVLMDDLVSAMDVAWKDKKLPRQPSSMDVIVHSTGGLIVRDWLTRYFTPTKSPIKHLLMLAPANFGSPLAQKGRALIGRVVVGLRSKKIFQTGTHILKALELASPYAWDLAMRDRFGRADYYGKGKILCTVLIGNTGYRGIRAAANEPGMDGTVRVSTANLNCAYCELDFTHPSGKPTFTMTPSQGTTAFGVMAGENHATIAAKDKGFANPNTLEMICRALSVTDAGFSAWCAELENQNQAVMQAGVEQTNTQGFQTTVCHLVNQYEKGVDDYFIEFFSDRADDDKLSEFFHSKVIRSVHAYQDDPSYRSLFVNCTRIQTILNNGYGRLHVSLTAMPAYGGSQLVGYESYDKDTFGELSLDKARIKQLFQENRTLLIKIKITRTQSEKLFQIQTLDAVKRGR